MSVVLEHITKIYGQQRAVDDLSFSVKKGEIVGLLGPNGAGKTTTMKMITGYLRPSSGVILVDDEDVALSGKSIRQKIGYLPENNPLYHHMYVREFLGFVAKVHKLKNVQEAVKDRIRQTGLEAEQHKKIGELSKGYKQRVGLAQAIMHDPEVLILDEPISGLDPNQLIEIRQLIKQLAIDKTIIFSSHILQEVEFICDRIIILDKGRCVADKPLNQMRHSVYRQYKVRFIRPVELKKLENMEDLESVDDLGDATYLLTYSQGRDRASEIFDFTVEQDNKLILLKEEVSTLEEVFQKMTIK